MSDSKGVHDGSNGANDKVDINAMAHPNEGKVAAPLQTGPGGALNSTGGVYR